MKMVIKVKKLFNNLRDLKQAHEREWFDLRVAEDIHMKAGEYKRIPLGVAVKLPDNCEAWVVPRSSTYEKWGILMANSIGIIDHKYCGENDMWQFPAIATRDITIPKNTRIAQFSVHQQQRFTKENVIYVKEMEDPNRGGIGSTGD